MSEIDDFLMRTDVTAQPDSEVDDFLMRRSKPEPAKKIETPIEQPSTIGTLTQASQATVGEFIDLLGLPGEAANWAMDKAGISTQFQTGKSLRELGAKAGITTREGEAPDTAATKVGQYIGMGLEFLAPFLSLGKAATMAKVAPGAVAPSVIPTTRIGKAKDIAATMASPFVAAPKLAAVSEVSGGAGAGVGAYYGGKEYGPTGEMIGGLAGGLGTQIMPALATTVARQARKSLLPMTK